MCFPRTVSTTILVLACCISWESAHAERDLFGLSEDAAPEELYWEILRLQAAGLLSVQTFAQVQRELDIVTAHYAADRDYDNLVRRVLIAALRRTYRTDPGEENAPLHAAQEGRAYARRLHSAGVREAETYAQRTVFIDGMLGVPTSKGELALIVAIPAGGYLVAKIAKYAFKKAALLLRGLRTPEEVLARADALGIHVEQIESRAGLEGLIGRDAAASVDFAPRVPEGLTVLSRGRAALPEEIARTFAGGRYHTKVLQQDVVAYRYSGGISAPPGRFLTTGQTVEQIGSPEAARRLLNLPSGATAEQLNAFIIPKGTTIYYGRVANGGSGTATQIFIYDPSVLRALP